jgi:hypothetical protein
MMGFWKTFREFDETSLLIMVIDLVSMIISSFIFYSSYGRIMSVASRIPGPDILLSLPLEQVKEIMTPDPTRQIMVSLVSAILLVVIVYCLGRAAVWQLSARRFDWRGWLKTSFILLIWFTVISLLIFQMWRILKQPFGLLFAAVSCLLMMHMALGLSVGMRKKQDVRTIWRSIKDSFRNIHKYLLLYLVVGLLLLLVLSLMVALPVGMLLGIIFAVILLAIFCWGRYFLLYLLAE